MNRSTTTDIQRPFAAHGVEFNDDKDNETQYVGACPFCGKDKKFYVNKRTGLWDCKVCGIGGDVRHFLLHAATEYEKALTPKLIAKLSANRKLPPDAFRDWHIGHDGRHYTLPAYLPNGKGVTDIRRFRVGQKSVISTAGAKVGLFGAEKIARHPSDPVFLFEGEWDCIAGRYLLQLSEEPGVCVAVPGAGIFRHDWAALFRGRIVHAHYDHDEPGRKGEVRLQKMLRGVAKRTTFVHWPDGSPTSYDVRDFVTEKPKQGLFVPRLRLKQLRRWYQDAPRKGTADAPARDLPANLSAFDQTLVGCTSEQDAVEILNRRHFTVKTGSKYVVGDERDGELLTLLPYEQFRNRYLWHQPFGKDLGASWLRSMSHRHYDGRVVFKPLGAPSPAREHDFNMWKGFAVEPKKGDWTLFQAHLLDNVCHGNEDWYDYLLNYFADMVQRPGRLPRVAIVLRGGEGVGKTCVFDYLAQMFAPEHSVLISSTRGLTGKFNAHLQSRVLVLADEAFFAGDHGVIGQLQSMITSPRLLVEPKGIDAFEVDNCMHLLIASNNERVIQAARHARRYFVLEVSDARQKDREYFTAITEQQNAGGTAAMLHDLQERDLTGFDPMDIPDTPYLNEQKELSLAPHETWLQERLMDEASWSREVEKSRFYDSYVQWTKTLGAAGRYPMTPSLLGRYLQDVFGFGIHYRRHNKRRSYLFPDLAECQRRFDAHHDLTTRWQAGVIRVSRKKQP